MCGIVGWYGDNSHINTRDLKGFFLEALHCDALRGQESTGIARIPRKPNAAPEVFKRALSGPDFVQNKGAVRLIEKSSDSYGFIGHNRSSTRGQVEDENAHPFQYKHITLVHNGTVYNSSNLLPSNRKCEADNPVDSAQVAWTFAHAEPDDLMHKMNGPFSLVWWDARDNTLHFARNAEKPMYWGVNAANNMMYYASELKMLTWLLDRNDIKVQSQMKYTAPGHHYIFKNPKNIEEYTVRPFLKAASKNPKAGGSGTSWDKNLSPKNNLPAVIPPVGHQAQRGGPLPNDSKVTQPSTTPPTTPTTTQTTPESEVLASPPKSTNTTGTGTIQTTGDAVTPEDQKRHFLTHDGKKHPAESERVKKGMVGTLLAGASDSKRKKDTRELANLLGTEAFKSILGTPKLWVPYENESGIGIMFLRHGRANIQVFNVSFAMWNKCTSSQDVKAIPLQIVSHRLTWDDTVFIGEIAMDAVERLLRAARAGKSAGPFRGFLDDEFDNDTDTVEVGLTNPRYVTKTEFHKLVESGCWKCDRVILDSEASQMGWYGADEDWPVCSTCFAQPVLRQEMEDATAMMDPPRSRVH